MDAEEQEGAQTENNEEVIHSVDLDVSSKTAEDPRNGIIFYLQQDNVRLEQELRLAHDQLDYYSKELSCKAKSQRVLEGKLKNATQQNNNLLAEMARFQAARTIAENQSDDARRVAVLQERLTELEQTSRAMREQLFEELRIVEAKLLRAEDSNRLSQEQLLELEKRADDWRKRFEDLSRENEALSRANEEVQNLESAIGEVKEEKAQLHQRLRELLDEKRQLIASREHLSNRIDESNSKIEMLQTKVKQINEARNENMMKMVEKENHIKELHARISELKQAADGERRTALRLREENDILRRQAQASQFWSAGGAVVVDECSLITNSPSLNMMNLDNDCVSMPYETPSTSHILCDGKDTRDAGRKPDEARKLYSAAKPAVNYSSLTHIRRFLQLLPHRRRSVKIYCRYFFISYFIIIHLVFLGYIFR